jgi:hypothetical protein
MKQGLLFGETLALIVYALFWSAVMAMKWTNVLTTDIYPSMRLYADGQSGW